MKTELSESLRNTPEGRRADAVLRKCVHCGFCNATCPTYRLLGDELDGPRGRIYLIKSLLEGKPCSRETRLHLDRCLTCRSCESTCPSGVEYNTLLEIGRGQVEQHIPRPVWQKLQRRLLMEILSRRRLFSILLGFARGFRPLMPAGLKAKIPPRPFTGNTGRSRQHQRNVILFQGCVQPALSPDTNRAAERVLDGLGIDATRVQGEVCCGALHHHLGDTRRSKQLMKTNIDHWWSLLERGHECVVTTASGCGLMIKDYAEVLQDDEGYAEKARIVSERTRDIAEFLTGEDREILRKLLPGEKHRLVFQSPCTLQHGQKLAGVTESLLASLGVAVQTPGDSHQCCGSAGTYSILQPGLSRQLRKIKLEKLTVCEPDMILTSNIGCQVHLQETADVRVKHWITLFETGNPG